MKIIASLLIGLAIFSVATAKQNSQTIQIIKDCQNTISDQVSCAKTCYLSNSILKQQTDFMIDCLSSPIIVLASSLISFLFLL
ncbi:hypothetical protein ABPG72_007348 [Tetrahymena utriculariae]